MFFGPIGKIRWLPWPLIGWDIFDFSSETTEQNSTILDRKQDLTVLYQVCVFRDDRKNKMASLTSDWLRHFRLLLWNRWTEFNETWQKTRSQRPLPSLCFSGRSEKTRRPPWPLIGWDIFDFSSETAERISTKLDRKQDLNILYQVCVFRAHRKNKMAALASDWLRHFRILLWNHWTEFNDTWQKTRSHRPLPSLCFSGRSKKQDGLPDLWLAETFSTSPLKPLNGIQRNLTGSKISTSSTKFVFFGPIGKTKWPPWPLIGWDIFEFSSETAEWNSTKLDRWQDLNVLYQFCVFRADWITRWPPWPLICRDIFDFSSEPAERNSTKLDRKQDLNVLYQVCVFRADQKNKMATLASDWLRHFRLLLWNRWTEFNETWQGAIGPIGKIRWPPWPLIGWDIFDFSSETAERNSTKLDRKQDLNVLYQVCVFRADRKNKMATLASDWLRHFRLFLWNRWTEFNETWQGARSQRPLPSLCFSGRSEKQDGRPGQSAKKVAHCTQVHDMWPFGPLVVGILLKSVVFQLPGFKSFLIFFFQLVKKSSQYSWRNIYICVACTLIFGEWQMSSDLCIVLFVKLNFPSGLY